MKRLARLLVVCAACRSVASQTCIDNPDFTGQWVASGRYSDSLPPCCSWDRGYNLQHTHSHYSTDRAFSCGDHRRESGFPGAWRGQPRQESSLLLQDSGGNGCACSPDRLAAIQRWQWVSEGCDLAEWDASAFCALLGNRSVLMIGDSTMEQCSAVLHNMIQWGGAGCAANLQFAAGDTLVGRLMGNLNRGFPWWQSVDALFPSAPPEVIVLSAGPHVYSKNDDMETRRLMADVWREVRDVFLKRYRNVTKLVWRTTTGAGCGSAEEPLRTSPARIPGWWEQHDEYNYRVMEEMDDQAVRWWNGVANATVLDLRSLWLRPDARVGNLSGSGADCLHQCQPGALHMFGVMLLNILRAWKEPQ